MQENNVKDSLSVLKELTNFSQNEKTYEIFSDDGHEDWMSKIWSADYSDYVEGEGQQRALKNRNKNRFHQTR